MECKQAYCKCEKCVAWRVQYRARNREKLNERNRTVNLTPEQRERRNKVRMERYYREQRLKKASLGASKEEGGKEESLEASETEGGKVGEGKEPNGGGEEGNGPVEKEEGK